MSKFSIATITKTALVTISCLIAVPANAAPAEDVFSINTHDKPRALPPLQATAQMKHDAETPKIGAGALAMMSADTPIVHWFENYDQIISNAKPSDTEQIILKRPMNQELERVQLMTKTCSDIAKRFRSTAKTLRKLSVQENWVGVKELRDNQADFYDQEAAVYESMIKPRPPSKTMEELDATLKTLQDDADAAKSYGEALASTDLNLRKKYGVHLARYKDDLAQYVMSTQKEGNFLSPK